PFRRRQLPVDPGRTLALEVPDRRGDPGPRGHAPQPVDVVRHGLTLDQIEILPVAWTPDDRPDVHRILAPSPATLLQNDPEVILSVPPDGSLVLPIFHRRPPALRDLPQGRPSRIHAGNSRACRRLAAQCGGFLVMDRDSRGSPALVLAGSQGERLFLQGVS